MTWWGHISTDNPKCPFIDPTHQTSYRGHKSWFNISRGCHPLITLTQDTNLVEVGEEYTSQVCGNCGFLHQELGSNKVFCCPSCDYELDRDLNSARNIYLKYKIEHLDPGLQGLP